MPRLAIVACLSICTLVSIGAVSPETLAAQGSPAQSTTSMPIPLAGEARVEVDVRCTPNNGVQFSLSPWTARLAQGDSIAWVLHPDANVSEITVTAKQPDWPFTSMPPYKGNATRGPKGKGMKPNQLNKRYAYAINTSCARADGTTSTVVIDPDMIIIR